MLDEALDKISCSMKIIIRRRICCQKFRRAVPLIRLYPDKVMFCSDDKHPDDLINGHINLLVKRALLMGYDIFDVLRIACINPVEHYGLPVGCLKEVVTQPISLSSVIPGIGKSPILVVMELLYIKTKKWRISFQRD